MRGRDQLIAMVAIAQDLHGEEVHAAANEVDACVVFGPPVVRCKRCLHDDTLGLGECEYCAGHDEEEVLGTFDTVAEMCRTPLEDILRAAELEDDGGRILVRCKDSPWRFLLHEESWAKEPYTTTHACVIPGKVWVGVVHMGCVAEDCVFEYPDGDEAAYDEAMGVFHDTVAEKFPGVSYSTGFCIPGAGAGAPDHHYAYTDASLQRLYDLMCLPKREPPCPQCGKREQALREGRSVRRSSRNRARDDVFDNERVVDRAKALLDPEGPRFVQLVAQAAAEDPSVLVKVWEARTTDDAVDALKIEI